MNKVITINLNGVAYQLEEGGYDALRAYLENAARRLEGNPDKDEIITDIEQAIADKFRALLGAHKTVVNVKEVAAVIADMGPVEDATKDGPTAEATKATAGRGPGVREPEESGGVRRLYRIYDGAMISGVCNGLGAYCGVDPTIFRILFVLLALAWGTGVVGYFLLVLLIPSAKTPAEKSAATGAAATAEEFIKRAREGYYEGMKSWHDRHARRAWKRKFKRDMRGWKHGYQQQQADYWKSWSQNWTQNWSQNWSQNWTQNCPAPGAQPPPSILGTVFLAPLLSILLFAAVVAMIYAIYSLAKYGAVFGLVMPATMPLWAGILIVVVAYLLVTWPLKAMRWACYYPGPYRGWGGPFGGLLGSLIGMFFLAFGIWSLNRHVPEFHEWLVQLPGLLHRLVDTVSGWFASKP